MISPEQVRNFVIISHVDHGKSTLADRLLELTGTVEARRMRPQYLDQMELEREKGITIKMQPVRMRWHAPHEPSRILARTATTSIRADSCGDSCPFAYMLNLIDTPGHADFSYEVSRALAAVEGAMLLVDATQGVEAQTLAHLHLARSQGLAIVPVVNKIDLPGARGAETEAELAAITGSSPHEILKISAKTGEGVGALLNALIERIPPPSAGALPARALIFDSQFDSYRGVIAHIRVFDGAFCRGGAIGTLASNRKAEIREIGYFAPALVAAESLASGEIGYLATGLKEPDAIRVGDTITTAEVRRSKTQIGAGISVPERSPRRESAIVEALPGYREPQPMVFASAYPEDAGDYGRFGEALAKMKLNDAAIVFEPESSEALGRGFRMGFLGMLHLEVAGERLRREYGLELIFAAPSVAYRLTGADGRSELVYGAGRMPGAGRIREIAEPWVRLELVTPAAYLGNVMELLAQTRGRYRSQASLGTDRISIAYETPLSDILVGFSDAVKRVTAGYGSYGYEFVGYRTGDLVRLDVLIAGEPQEALAEIVPREEAYRAGRRVVEKLKALLPRALFAVSIQAAVGGRIIARETLPALKKDVTGYLYGGDRTRKMKLWSKQQRGKERMKKTGRVEIPPSVFRELLKSNR